MNNASAVQPQPVVLQSDALSVTFLPALGGKISSLRSVRSGREFLIAPLGAYRASSWGDTFGEFQANGFDDCLPTVAACNYPDGAFLGTALPDHGEIWSGHSQCDARPDGILLTAQGVQLPYVFRKAVSLSGSRLRFDYELENLSAEPIHYMWSAHPLLAMVHGMRILLPREVRRVLVESSRAERLGSKGQYRGWPMVHVDGSQTDLSCIQPQAAPIADKLFTDRLSVGRAGLYIPDSDETLVFHFDVSKTPYIGLWMCQGGWPEHLLGTHHALAIEPCNGRPDSLAEAAGRGECARLNPRFTEKWWLEVVIVSGMPDFAEGE